MSISIIALLLLSAISLLLLGGYYLTKRIVHYRRVRALADAIAHCVQVRGVHGTAYVEDSAARLYGVPRQIVRVTHLGGHWLEIRFIAPVARPKVDLFILTQQTQAFLPTWANFKLLTTDEDPNPPRALSPAEQRKAAFAEAMAKLAEDERREAQGRGGG